MTTRLAVGESLDLEKVTRRRIWRGITITKDAVVTDTGHRISPASLRHLAHLIEKSTRTMQQCSQLHHRLYKVEHSLMRLDKSAWRQLDQIEWEKGA